MENLEEKAFDRLHKPQKVGKQLHKHSGQQRRFLLRVSESLVPHHSALTSAWLLA